MGTRIGNYFRTHSDPNPDPADQATAEDLRKLLLAGRKSEAELVRSAPVEEPEVDDRIDWWDTRQPRPTPPAGEERIEDRVEDEPRGGPEGRGTHEPPADGVRATTEEGVAETQAPPQGDTLDLPQDQPTLTPPPATQGQARPSAADFMAQAADTPSMITEGGEEQEQDRAMAAPAGNQPEVPE